MKISKNILKIIGKILLTSVIISLLAALVMIALSLLGQDTMVIDKSFIFIQALCFITAVVVMYAWFERKSQWFLGWIQDYKWKSWLVGSGWGIIMITITFLTIWLFGGLKVSGISFHQTVIQSLIYWILLFLLVSISEELLCRGYLQGLIRHHFGVTTGIVVTSALFATLHLMNENVLENPVPLINLFLAGVMFGVVREVTSGLWIPIGIHFTWNLFQGNVFGFTVSGLNTNESIIHIDVIGSDLISGGGFGAEGSLITSLLLVLYTILVWFWYRKKSVVKKKAIENKHEEESISGIS